LKELGLKVSKNEREGALRKFENLKGSNSKEGV
jgi:hypothetical protein